MQIDENHQVAHQLAPSSSGHQTLDFSLVVHQIKIKVPPSINLQLSCTYGDKTIIGQTRKKVSKESGTAAFDETFKLEFPANSLRDTF
jgi:hypothetical protein